MLYLFTAAVVLLLVVVARAELQPREGEPSCAHCGSGNLTSSLRRQRCLDCGKRPIRMRNAMRSRPPGAMS
jgi:hypothetical protein